MGLILQISLSFSAQLLFVEVLTYELYFYFYFLSAFVFSRLNILVQTERKTLRVSLYDSTCFNSKTRMNKNKNRIPPWSYFCLGKSEHIKIKIVIKMRSILSFPSCTKLQVQRSALCTTWDSPFNGGRGQRYSELLGFCMQT